MAKTKSKPSAAAPEKKAGDGGRIKKQTSAMEQTKATAKSVVKATKNAASKAVAAAADTEAGSKLKGILKNAVVAHNLFIVY
jgi:type II secretory pathway component PulM